MSIDMTVARAATRALSAVMRRTLAVVGKQQVRIGATCSGLRIDIILRASWPRRAPLPADGLPALRERALRAGLPGGRDGAYDPKA